MFSGLITSFQNVLSKSTTPTALPTNNTTINFLPTTSVQNLTNLAAKVESAIESGEKRNWDVEDSGEAQNFVAVLKKFLEKGDISNLENFNVTFGMMQKNSSGSGAITLTVEDIATGNRIGKFRISSVKGECNGNKAQDNSCIMKYDEETRRFKPVELIDQAGSQNISLLALKFFELQKSGKINNHNKTIYNLGELLEVYAKTTYPLKSTTSTAEITSTEVISSTMQEIRESNISMLTPSKQMEDGTLNNGEVSIPFAPRKNISGHNIRILNSTYTVEPTPVPQDSAGGSYLAAVISFGILLSTVVLIGLGTAYYMRKRSGSYNANKWNNSESPEASTETNTSPKLSRLESIKEELEGRSSTDLPEEANPLLPKASTGIINPPAKPSRLERIQKEDHATEVIDSSSTTEQLAEVVVHEGQQGAEGQTPLDQAVQALRDAAEMLWYPRSFVQGDIRRPNNGMALPNATRDSEGPYSSLTELGNVTKKSDNNLRRASS